MKAVLLHKSNKRPSIPLFFGTDKKEDYDSFENLFKFIKYDEHKWKICCDLKVVNIVCGLKSGFPNFMCYKCNWNTRDDRGWGVPQIKGPNPDIKQEEKLVDAKDVLIPPLHIKLGLVQKKSP